MKFTTLFFVASLLLISVGCGSMTPVQPATTPNPILKQQLLDKVESDDGNLQTVQCDQRRPRLTNENTTPFVPAVKREQDCVTKAELLEVIADLKRELTTNKTQSVDQVQSAQIKTMQQQSTTLQAMLHQQTAELQRQAYEREKAKWRWYTGAVIYVSDPEKSLRGERTDCLHCDNLISGLIQLGWGNHIGLDTDSHWILRKANQQAKPVIEYWEDGKVKKRIIGFSRPIKELAEMHYYSKGSIRARKVSSQAHYFDPYVEYVQPPVINSVRINRQPVQVYRGITNPSYITPQRNCANGVCY